LVITPELLKLLSWQQERRQVDLFIEDFKKRFRTAVSGHELAMVFAKRF